MAGARRKTGGEARDPWLFLIGLFKLTKAAALLIVGIGLLKLVHRDVAAVTMHWVERFRLDPDNKHIHEAISRVFRVTPKQLRELSVGTFVYAGIFGTEGTGLLLRKHWAEYLTLVSTGLFIPLEIYELTQRFTVFRLAIFAVNVATVWYLAVRLRRRRG
jgi:uncharacterized membrane protein (DUF2068 family)